MVHIKEKCCISVMGQKAHKYNQHFSRVRLWCSTLKKIWLKTVHLKQTYTATSMFSNQCSTTGSVRLWCSTLKKIWLKQTYTATSLFSNQCSMTGNKGCGMYYPVCGMVHIKEPLLLIGKSSPCGSSRFPLSLSEWSFTI